MKFLQRLVASVCVLALGGCGLLDDRYAPLTADLAASAPLIKDRTLNISPSVTLPLESVLFWGAYTAAAYSVLLPFAPNWDVKEAAFHDDHVLMTMKMKRFYTGGAGEARHVFQQRAKELMLQGGFNGYQIVEYSEGMDSSMLGSQRTARGVVQLTFTER
jgi:hypothetical protein